MRHKWLLFACVGVILVHASTARPEQDRDAVEGSAVQIADLGHQSSTQYPGFSSNDNSSSAKSGRALITPFIRKSTTKSPSSICTISTINYDCVLKNVKLYHNESKFFGLDWKNNPQKNITFTNSRLAYLPQSLFNAFPSMELLNAEDLQIEEIEDKAFKHAGNLQNLYLQKNEISSIQTFQGVPLLIHLDLSHNKIIRIEYGAFQKNINLKNILMNNNQISELPSFQNIENLKVLDLSNNELHEINDNQFIGNTKLQNLDFSYNHLRHLNLDQLDDMRELSVVDISNNNLERLHIPKYIRRLDARKNSIQDITSNGCKVEQIYLSHNRVTDISTLQKCASIKTLDLSYNKLQNFDLIGYLPNLQILNLTNNQLFQIDLATKISHPLQILDLSYNQLSYGPANKFSNLKVVKLNNNKFIEFKFDQLKSLTFVQLGYNEWKCDKIQDIMKQIDHIVGDANETCMNSNKRSQDGICCRDYKRAFIERLNEILRDINHHENVNKQDSKKCKQTKPMNSATTLDMQTLHDKTANLDKATKEILQQIENAKSKIDIAEREINSVKTQQSQLQAENQKYKQIVEKLRNYYGITKEGLIGSYVTLNRIEQFTREKNSLSIDLLARRTQEREDTNDRLDRLNTKKVNLNDENENHKALLADLKKKEAALKKEDRKSVV